MQRFLVVALLCLVSCGDDETTTGTPRQGGSSSGSSGASSGTVAGTGSTEQEKCWSTINAYRQTLGLPPYARWTDGESCATEEAQSDAATNKPHGAFPKCGELAQNECPGLSMSPEKGMPACLKLMWDEGPGGGHYEAMASKKYTKVACGIFVTDKGLLWSVQNFR